MNPRSRGPVSYPCCIKTDEMKSIVQWAPGYCSSGTRLTPDPLSDGSGALGALVSFGTGAGQSCTLQLSRGKAWLAASLCNCLQGAPCSSHLTSSAHLSVVSEMTCLPHPILFLTVTHSLIWSHLSLLSPRNTPGSSQFCSKSPFILFVCLKFFFPFPGCIRLVQK